MDRGNAAPSRSSASSATSPAGAAASWLLLVARLAFFVLLPTFLAGYYYYRVATPLYATKSEFVIQKADAPGGSGLGGLFSGTQLATTQDSITVQAYLQSRDAMLRLDKALGFKKAFRGPNIDPIQRLPPDASNEAGLQALSAQYVRRSATTRPRASSRWR